MNIKADTGAIQQAGSQFASHASELANLMSQVQKDIQNLSSLWQGPAAGQFTALMQDWNKNQMGIQQDLSDVSTKLGQSSTGYQDLESQLQKGFQGY